MKVRKENKIGDLVTFLQLVEFLDSRRSMREAADAMRLAPQRLSDVIGRLEHQLGATLIERSTNSPLSLTTDGERLQKKLRSCLRPVRRRPLRVKVAHSLMQNLYFLSQINAFDLDSKAPAEQEGPTAAVPKERSSPKVEMSTGINLDDNKEIERILTGELDALICWSLPQRKRKWSKERGIDFREIGPVFPLALITNDLVVLQECLCNNPNAHDKPYMPTGAIKFKALSKYRCALLDHDKQPLVDKLVEYGLFYFAGNREKASSFSMIVEMVKRQMAHFGIVPLIGSELNMMAMNGELFFKALEPGDKDPLRIAVVTRSIQDDYGRKFKDINAIDRRTQMALQRKHMAFRRTQMAFKLIEYLDRSLNSSYSNNVGWGAVLEPLPEAPEFYQRFKHGYFLFASRMQGDTFIQSSHAEWVHEDVQGIDLERRDEGRGELILKLGAKPRIKNDLDDHFLIESAQYSEGVFSFSAREVSVDVNHETTGKSFVAIFNAAVSAMLKPNPSAENKEDSIMVGLWNSGGHRNPIRTWSIVYSTRTLNDDELNAISRSAAMTYTLSSRVAGKVKYDDMR